MRTGVSILLLPLILLVLSCSEEKERVIPEEGIEEGDLAFRCGRGVFSRIVTTAEEEGVYSHVGLVVRDEGKWKVAHAVPAEPDYKGDFDRVKLEDIEVFFAPDRAWSGCLVRPGVRDPERMCAEAIRAARDSVAFDGGYDLTDSSKVYCTEFVWRLYMQDGTDLSEGRRRHINALGVNGDVILPEHLLKYNDIEPYYKF